MAMLLFALALQAAPAPTFDVRPCPDAELQAIARCGVVRVPEDRSRRGGRTIDLHVVILPATGPRRLPPLFDIDGGPGLPSTKNVAFYASDGAAYRAARDVVMVDQRGTGRSNGLHCPEVAAPRPWTEPMLPPDAVRRCRASLSARADLRHYGTREAIADLDAVRIALGHERIDISAISYGTTVALRYMAAYPGRVRAAVLMGAAPPDAMPPRAHAEAGQRALDLILADCRADPACRAAFPDPAGDLDRALAPLAPERRELFMERLRSLAYTPAGARRIPLLLNRAAVGDLAPFEAATRRTQPTMEADGVFLGVTCTESFGLMDYEAAAARSRATRFGDYRLRRQRAACDAWPRGQAAADHLALPRGGEAAVLVMSGRLDPVTPPEWGDTLAARMPRTRNLILPFGGHIPDGLSNIDCFDGLMLRFYEQGGADGLDAACLATMQPPPFVSGS